MAEWLIEHGIGEDRALLVEGDRVLAAKLRWPDELHAGAVVDAKVARRVPGTWVVRAVDPKGREIQVDRVPAKFTEGAKLTVQITRAAIAETGRLKTAKGRAVVDSKPPEPNANDLFLLGDAVRRFPAGLWEDVWQSAAAGEVAFPHGSLLFNVTPAMTLVDIDGSAAPLKLALGAVDVLARAFRLFDLGGAIGIDFPTLHAKADRKAVDAALQEALADWPHERTAMNGFGFVHIVSRLDGPSLLHRFATARAAMAARMALRRAERVEGPGMTLLTVNPAVKPHLRRPMLAELERTTGRSVRVQTDRALAVEAAQAQIVPR